MKRVWYINIISSEPLKYPWRMKMLKLGHLLNKNWIWKKFSLFLAFLLRCSSFIISVYALERSHGKVLIMSIYPTSHSMHLFTFLFDFNILRHLLFNSANQKVFNKHTWIKMPLNFMLLHSCYLWVSATSCSVLLPHLTRGNKLRGN